MFKKISLKLGLVLTVLSLFGFVGCSPKGDPSQVINSYYDNIKNGNTESAYDLLAESSKKNFVKEDFIKWQKTQSEFETLKSVKVDKLNEYKNKELDGVTYKNAVEFNVTEGGHSNYSNKDVPLTYKRYVVNDNGEWKVYRDKENGKDLLAESMINLASMYADGKGKDKDLNQAASILNDSVKMNPNYNGTYYALSSAYCSLDRYDESISAANKYLSNAKDTKDQSDEYNILGLDYEGKQDYENAKKYYNQAIQLDANNQYAKTNLERLNRINN